MCLLPIVSGCAPKATQAPPETTAEETASVETAAEETAAEETAAEETAVEETVAQETAAEEPAEETTAEETAAEEPAQAPIGGSLIIGVPDDIDSLDPQMAENSSSLTALWFLGGTLVSKDVDGNIVPYLAKSWEISDDGLTYTFVLRDDVKFHDGTPLTAQDFVYSFERLRDPDLGSFYASAMGQVDTVVAVDDYTLQYNLLSLMPYLLESLSSHPAFQPLLKSAVEAAGDQYATKHVGVGPYKIKEFVMGDKLVLERNPDFAWAPDDYRQGPYNVEFLEFHIIPEPATMISGLEAGEIDVASIEAKDIEQITGTGNFEIIESLQQGMKPMLHFNCSQAPFDDILVRQALNMALNRDDLIKVMLDGYGIPQFGPLSPTIPGYWTGVEEIGYTYDPEQVKAKMEEAGYTLDADGWWQKDGQRLDLTLVIYSTWSKLAEVLREQFRAVGINMEIELMDEGLVVDEMFAGNYQIGALGYMFSNPSFLAKALHPVTAWNIGKVTDDELAALIDKTQSTVDPDERMQYVYDVQKRMVEQAYYVPLYVPKTFMAVSTRLQGEFASPDNGRLKIELNDAYLEP